MPRLLALSPVLLAACTTTPAAPLAHGETPGHTCNASATDRFIGQEGTSQTGAEIMKATHTAVLRWSPPGYMLTMDYRADRVTVWLGPNRTITQIKCG